MRQGGGLLATAPVCLQQQGQSDMDGWSHKLVGYKALSAAYVECKVTAHLPHLHGVCQWRCQPVLYVVPGEQQQEGS